MQDYLACWMLRKIGDVDGVPTQGRLYENHLPDSHKGAWARESLTWYPCRSVGTIAFPQVPTQERVYENHLPGTHAGAWERESLPKYPRRSVGTRFTPLGPTLRVGKEMVILLECGTEEKLFSTSNFLYVASLPKYPRRSVGTRVADLVPTLCVGKEMVVLVVRRILSRFVRNHN